MPKDILGRPVTKKQPVHLTGIDHDKGPSIKYPSNRKVLLQLPRFWVIVLLLLFCAQTTMAQLQQPPDTTKLPFLSGDIRYLWPTSASDYMSATFGETRSAHFHAAVDIGTWGQRGYRVYATRDGIVSRVGVSPTGYGNVVYLKHEDGTFSVYAHLQDFVPEIRSAVDEVRFRDYSADFDQNLEHLNIRFNQGDLIAYSGDTGIGPPHLHFELRSPNNNPFNPLLAGVRVADRVPPRFASLAVEPLSPDASVNGRKQIQRTPIRGSERTFSFNSVTVTGEVGLAVDVSDRADAMRNVYAVYELKLFVNDSLYFHSKVDSFAIASGRMMFLDRIFPLLREHRRGYQRLWVRDGNLLPFYLQHAANKPLRLTPGTWRIRIEASDFFGNTSRATGNLIVREPAYWNLPITETSHPPIVLPPSATDGLPRNLTDLFWTNNWFSNPSDRRTPSISSQQLGSFSNVSLVSGRLETDKTVDLTGNASRVITIDDRPMLLHRVLPGSASVIRTPDQRLQLEIREQSLFDTLSVAIAYRYEQESVFIEIGPSEHEPLRSSVRLRFLLNDLERQIPGIGLYSVNGNGTNRRFGYVGGSVQGGVLTANISSFGTYTIQSDTTAPGITRPRIFRRNDGKWFATVRVSDERSGVDYRSAEIYVNGIRGIAEYDPFSGLLIYHLPGFSPRAQNEIRVEVSDRAGNRARAVFERVGRS
jgi:hypothetical protein